MKNFNIFSFILGGICFVLMSATAIKTELLTVKPASPKSYVVYDGEDPAPFIRKWAKQGYITKCMAGAYGNTTVVMEKY